MKIAFDVDDPRPVGQGSLTPRTYKGEDGETKTSLRWGNGDRLYLWRAAVRIAAQNAGATNVGRGPIGVSVTFGMQRPKDQMHWRGGKMVPKMQYWYNRPAVAPDLDHLIRSVLDALTGVCYADDAQVVEVTMSKVYADSTHIEVWSVSEDPTAISLGLGQDEKADTRAR